MSADLQPGTHLTTRRRGYVHHGLYAGDGRVIHYRGYGPRLRRGPVEEVTLDEFAGGRGWQARPWVAPAYAGTSAVERARTRLGEDRYSLFSNNCEHFVEWVIGGTPRSAQVEALTAPVKNGLARIGALLPLVGRRRRGVEAAVLN
jgi:HRAS-like suppressor 3